LKHGDGRIRGPRYAEFSAAKSRGLIEARRPRISLGRLIWFSAAKSRGLIEASTKCSGPGLASWFSAAKSRGLIEALLGKFLEFDGFGVFSAAKSRGLIEAAILLPAISETISFPRRRAAASLKHMKIVGILLVFAIVFRGEEPRPH